MNREYLVRDENFATLTARHANRDQLDRIVGEWTRNLNAHELEALLQHRGVPASAVQDSADVARDPQLAGRGYLVEVEHPVIGRTVVEGSRFLLSRTPAQVKRAAPCVGGDNQYLLESILGYDQERITELVKSGALE
jgi:benzylsuccinate CoA-transferase BbsF subunit